MYTHVIKYLRSLHCFRMNYQVGVGVHKRVCAVTGWGTRRVTPSISRNNEGETVDTNKHFLLMFLPKGLNRLQQACILIPTCTYREHKMNKLVIVLTSSLWHACRTSVLRCTANPWSWTFAQFWQRNFQTKDRMQLTGDYWHGQLCQLHSDALQMTTRYKSDQHHMKSESTNHSPCTVPWQ